jgi:hypothetical protein
LFPQLPETSRLRQAFLRNYRVCRRHPFRPILRRREQRIGRHPGDSDLQQLPDESDPAELARSPSAAAPDRYQSVVSSLTVMNLPEKRSLPEVVSMIPD